MPNLSDVLTPCLSCETTGVRKGYEDEDCRSCEGSGWKLTGRAADVRALMEIGPYKDADFQPPERRPSSRYIPIPGHEMGEA